MNREDLGAELAERLSIRQADATRRRQARTEIRRQLQAARQAGLIRRHQQKENQS